MGAQQRLSHLSVGELFRLLGEDTAQITKEDVRALPGKVLEAGEGQGRSLDAEDAFAYWLQREDAYPIDDQGAWWCAGGALLAPHPAGGTSPIPALAGHRLGDSR
jgi:hypothetical protein